MDIPPFRNGLLLFLLWYLIELMLTKQQSNSVETANYFVGGIKAMTIGEEEPSPDCGVL